MFLIFSLERSYRALKDYFPFSQKKEMITSTGEKLTFTFTPTQHWCTRTGFDKNQALWGSWAVCSERVKTWFGGDTGYCKQFVQWSLFFYRGLI